MKLSMWMIANRISSLDIETNFTNEGPVILKSARRVYATNCVHVFQSGSDVICNGEGNYIRLKDMKVDQAFEIIQSVFDFYEDWHNMLLEACEIKDYQKLIDSCWHVFHNPLLLFDGNCKLLAMSNQYPADSLDNEWHYLSIYGYSSLSAIQFIKYDCSKNDFTSSKIQRYNFSHNSVVKMGGITAGIYCDDGLCGRINLLEHDHPFNTGDYQILRQIIRHLSFSMGIGNMDKSKLSYHNIFYSLVLDQKIVSEELKIQMEYMHWNMEDTFRITILTPINDSVSNEPLFILCHIIRNTIIACNNFVLNNKIIIITNEKIIAKQQLLKNLKPIISQNSLKASVSLPCHNIMHLSYIYRQAVSAFHYADLYHNEQIIFDIYDYGLDYIIESRDIKTAFFACHPDIMTMWEQKEEIGPDTIQTFQSYLENERSIINTAQELYVHRNTIVYRIKKIIETLHYDLENPYTRDYMKISLKVLNLYEKSTCKKNDTERGIF